MLAVTVSHVLEGVIHMRRGFRLFGLLATVTLLAVVGVVAYNIGWSDGLSTHLPEGATAAPYYYGYGPHLLGAGFGIFGLLSFLFVMFVVFSLFRIAFFGRRMMMGGGWGGPWGRGRGSYGHGHGMPSGIDQRMQEWHRRAHGEQPPTPPGTGSAAPPDQSTV
jgi:hypothetical protein